MKIIVSLDEVKVIVATHLMQRGVKLRNDSADIQKHVEGQYDEAMEVMDGIAFDLE